MDPTPPAPAPLAPKRPERRSFLFGGVAGLLGGAGAVAAAKAPGWAWNTRPGHPEGTKLSYAQFGEDLVAAGLFYALGIDKPTYLDIGAHRPIKSNNTYLFYTRGARGVLVEPNVALTDELKRERPRDALLVAGIGVDDTPEADYYVMSADELNTFDKAQAERLQREVGQRVLGVIKMPLLNINRVIAEHFGGAAPDYLSIDIEGLEAAVVKSLDLARFRPKLICVDTLVTSSLVHNPEAANWLTEKGYELRGMTHPNAFFVDKRLLK